MSLQIHPAARETEPLVLRSQSSRTLLKTASFHVVKKNELPNFEIIQHVWNQIKRSLNRKTMPARINAFFDIRSNMELLGINKKDRSAFKAFKSIVSSLGRAQIRIEPFDDDDLHSGIYKIYFSDENETPDAIFKIGAKRGLYETAVRSIALELNLAECVVPRMFFAYDELEGSSSVDEELWNSRVKSGVLSKAVGIVEPFIPADEEKSFSQLSFAKLILFAAAIGGRDLKRDGIINGSVFIDTEECMPEMNEDAVAQLHVPFVLTERNDEDEYLLQNLTPENRAYLQRIVQSWNIDRLCSRVESLRIKFEDKASEKTALHARKGIDDSGMRVSYRAILGQKDECLQVLPKREDVSQNRKMFTEGQLRSFRIRLERIKELFATAETLSPKDILFAADPILKAHYEQMMIERLTRGRSPFLVLGTKTPAHLKSSSSAREECVEREGGFPDEFDEEVCEEFGGQTVCMPGDGCYDFDDEEDESTGATHGAPPPPVRDTPSVFKNIQQLESEEEEE